MDGEETDGNAAVEATSREGMSELRGDSKSEQELSSPDSPSLQLGAEEPKAGAAEPQSSAMPTEREPAELCDERASLGVWANVACNPTTEAVCPAPPLRRLHLLG